MTCLPRRGLLDDSCQFGCFAGFVGECRAAAQLGKKHQRIVPHCVDFQVVDLFFAALERQQAFCIEVQGVETAADDIVDDALDYLAVFAVYLVAVVLLVGVLLNGPDEPQWSFGSKIDFADAECKSVAVHFDVCVGYFAE